MPLGYIKAENFVVLLKRMQEDAGGCRRMQEDAVGGNIHITILFHYAYDAQNHGKQHETGGGRGEAYPSGPLLIDQVGCQTGSSGLLVLKEEKEDAVFEV